MLKEGGQNLRKRKNRGTPKSAAVDVCGVYLRARGLSVITTLFPTLVVKCR